MPQVLHQKRGLQKSFYLILRITSFLEKTICALLPHSADVADNKADAPGVENMEEELIIPRQFRIDCDPGEYLDPEQRSEPLDVIELFAHQNIERLLDCLNPTPDARRHEEISPKTGYTAQARENANKSMETFETEKKILVKDREAFHCYLAVMYRDASYRTRQSFVKLIESNKCFQYCIANFLANILPWSLGTLIKYSARKSFFRLAFRHTNGCR